MGIGRVLNKPVFRISSNRDWTEGKSHWGSLKELCDSAVCYVNEGSHQFYEYSTNIAIGLGRYYNPYNPKIEIYSSIPMNVINHWDSLSSHTGEVLNIDRCILDLSKIFNDITLKEELGIIDDIKDLSRIEDNGTVLSSCNLSECFRVSEFTVNPSTYVLIMMCILTFEDYTYDRGSAHIQFSEYINKLAETTEMLKELCPTDIGYAKKVLSYMSIGQIRLSPQELLQQCNPSALRLNTIALRGIGLAY